MANYLAKISWAKGKEEDFVDNKYCRGHSWEFDGGLVVQASSSPHIVPSPYSVEANVDPEEAFVASLSSCHMLFFLSVAAKKKFVVERYTDNAVGMMTKDQDNKMSMTEVILRPKVEFSGERQPTIEQLEKMHHQSHEQCFIANSVKTDISIEMIV